MADEEKIRYGLIFLLFFLLAAIVFGLIWFFFLSSTPVGVSWYLFSFAAGLTMIVLPCTLPLAFVIVPLSMGKGPVKGFLIALAFGLGVAITLSFYGVAAAALGKVAIGSLGAPLEVVKNWLYFTAGLFAYLFSLGELGLINFRMPTYSGALPIFIQKQQEVVKAFLLGLFLGNIGVGCPHPATPLILTQIAVSGSLFYGWLLFFVHAVGRIIPLLFLAILGILGVNALTGLVKHKEKIARATGWGMVFVAAFILVLGFFSHDWWVLSGQHTFLESLTQEETFLTIIGQRSGAAAPHRHILPPAEARGLLGVPIVFGTWVLLLLWIMPFFWDWRKKKKNILIMPESPEKEYKKKMLSSRFWNIILLSAVLVLVFGYILPHRFFEQAIVQEAERNHMEDTGAMAMPAGHEHGPSIYHEEGDVKEGIIVLMNVLPAKPKIGEKVKLEFIAKDLTANKPVADLEIEHEKYMHIIGVRDDLNEFFHTHPTPVLDSKGNSLPGRWSVDYIFNRAGRYKIWTDVKWHGATHSFGHPFFEVSGEQEKSVKQTDFSTSVVIDKYKIDLHHDNVLAKGAAENLHFEIKDLTSGQSAEIEPYLGSLMHLTIIKDDLRHYIHTHPEEVSQMHSFLLPRLIDVASAHEESPSSIPMPEMQEGGLTFHVAFPEAGTYKAFAQFRPKGINLPSEEALTVSFYLKVSESKPATQIAPPVTNWWRNLFVSLVLIVILGYLVKKYITVPLKITEKKSNEDK